MNLNGFLNLNKPPNFTSHDCVAKLRRILKTKKIGHGGTLDPLATGVLPIAIGKATRLLQFLPTEKAYQGKIRFGIVTDTDDLEGNIISQKSANNLTLEQIKPFLKDFIGKIQQIPPAYSAIKKEGKKLYELARKGEKIDIPSREVEIFNLEIVDWQPSEYPELTLNIFCSSGTYIRSIARDLGEKLGYGATLASLNRTLSCAMNLKESFTFEEIITAIENQNLTLISLDNLLQNLPKINLDQEKSVKWSQGQKILFNSENEFIYCLIYDHNNQFLGISEIRENEEEKYLKPKVVFNNYTH